MQTDIIYITNINQKISLKSPAVDISSSVGTTTSDLSLKEESEQRMSPDEIERLMNFDMMREATSVPK